MPAARLLIWLVAISTLALVLADARPAIARVGRETVIQKRLRLERAALKNIKDTSGAVKQAARNMEQARRQLNEARRKATGAHDQFVKLQRVNDRATHDDTTQAQYERRLLSQRAVTLACLFGFTFMNGLARRSLSSAGPSMVAEGVIGYPYIEHVFLVGFEVFAVGKMLAGFVLLLLGNVRALLMQVALMAAACAWYVIEPRSAQMHAWILFRVVSGMASTTMLPFVGAWFPRKWYGRVFALLFAGFQAGYLVCSYYWGHLLARGKLHWTVPLVQSGAGFALLFAACLLWLRERPPPPPSRSAAAAATTRHGAGTGTAVVQPGTLPAAAAGTPSAAGTPPPHAPPAKLALRALFYKLATRWVFWAMLLACAAYSPAVEYASNGQSDLTVLAAPFFTVLAAPYLATQLRRLHVWPLSKRPTRRVAQLLLRLHRRPGSTHRLRPACGLQVLHPRHVLPQGDAISRRPRRSGAGRQRGHQRGRRRRRRRRRARRWRLRLPAVGALRGAVRFHPALPGGHAPYPLVGEYAPPPLIAGTAATSGASWPGCSAARSSTTERRRCFHPSRGAL